MFFSHRFAFCVCFLLCFRRKGMNISHRLYPRLCRWSIRPPRIPTPPALPHLRWFLFSSQRILSGCQLSVCFERWCLLSPLSGIHFLPFYLLLWLSMLWVEMKKEIIFYKLWQTWNLLEACCSISHSYMKGRSDPGLGDNCLKKLKYCLDSLLSLPLMSINLSHSLYFLLLQFLPSPCKEQATVKCWFSLLCWLLYDGRGADSPSLGISFPDLPHLGSDVHACFKQLRLWAKPV